MLALLPLRTFGILALRGDLYKCSSLNICRHLYPFRLLPFW